MLNASKGLGEVLRQFVLDPEAIEVSTSSFLMMEYVGRTLRLLGHSG